MSINSEISKIEEQIKFERETTHDIDAIQQLLTKWANLQLQKIEL